MDVFAGPRASTSASIFAAFGITKGLPDDLDFRRVFFDHFPLILTTFSKPKSDPYSAGFRVCDPQAWYHRRLQFWARISSLLLSFPFQNGSFSASADAPQGPEFGANSMELLVVGLFQNMLKVFK